MRVKPGRTVVNHSQGAWLTTLSLLVVAALALSCGSHSQTNEIVQPLTCVADLCGSWHVVELTATKQPNKKGGHEKSGVDQHAFCEPIDVLVPSRLDVAAGLPGHGWTEVRFEGPKVDVTCRYRGDDARNGNASYVLNSCNKGVRGGQILHAQRFALEVESGDEKAGPTTVRVSLGNGQAPAPDAYLDIIGTTPNLQGVTLHVPAGSVGPFSGIGLADGPPFERRDFVAMPPSGILVAGASVQVNGSGAFGPGVRLTVPYDAEWIGTLPPGSLDTLQLVNVAEVSGPLEAIEGTAVTDSVTRDSAARTLAAGLSAAGTYLTSIRDLTPITYHDGALITHGARIYIVWAGDFDGQPNDPRAAVRQFIGDFGNSIHYEIQDTYGVTNHIVTLAGETERRDLTNVDAEGEANSVMGVIQKAINDQALPFDLGGIYLVVGAPGVGAPRFCDGLCGWHGSRVGAGFTDPFKIGFIGHPATCKGCDGLPKGVTPNGRLIDGVLSILAHEIEETVTDPERVTDHPEIGGWYGTNEGVSGESDRVENADKCAWVFPSLEGDGTDASPKYNMTAGGHRYLIQANWVNQEEGYCAMGIEHVVLKVVGSPGGLALNGIGRFRIRVTNPTDLYFVPNKLVITGRPEGPIAGEPLPFRVQDPLRPGQSVDLDVQVQAPNEIDGNVQDVPFTFRAYDQRTGHHFTETATINIPVRRAEVLVDQAECVGVIAPVEAPLGSQLTGTMTFRNVGTTIWEYWLYHAVSWPLDIPPVVQFDWFTRTISPQDTVQISFGGKVRGSSGDVISIEAEMANPASAFPAKCSTQVRIVCAATNGTPCGACGNGTYQCDGTCAGGDPPPGLGDTCHCVGQRQCDGTCSSPPAPGSVTTSTETYDSFLQEPGIKTFGGDCNDGFEFDGCTVEHISGLGKCVATPSSPGGTDCRCRVAFTGGLFEGAICAMTTTQVHVCP